MGSRESKIRQAMYNILSGRRMVKIDASNLGGVKGDRCETFDKLHLTATREYPVGENYVTTKLGYRTFWIAWLKINYEGMGKMIGFGPQTNGGRTSKVKEFDDFANNRYSLIGREDSSNTYTGWVYGERERTYMSLDEASKDLSEMAVAPFLAREREERDLTSRVKADLNLNSLKNKARK